MQPNSTHFRASLGTVAREPLSHRQIAATYRANMPRHIAPTRPQPRPALSPDPPSAPTRPQPRPALSPDPPSAPTRPQPRPALSPDPPSAPTRPQPRPALSPDAGAVGGQLGIVSFPKNDNGTRNDYNYDIDSMADVIAHIVRLLIGCHPKRYIGKARNEGFSYVSKKGIKGLSSSGKRETGGPSWSGRRKRRPALTKILVKYCVLVVGVIPQLPHSFTEYCSLAITSRGGNAHNLQIGHSVGGPGSQRDIYLSLRGS
ncbi:uncharacterized protein LOC119577165 [Penaeus monodon]|uniref:uncharacterized protein LOC119577165 n=1 Tax=Penaeus monodon TaxID=6687 RepID=UPI0018A795DB|nr:uncharacterized protein LOC119577165 [Penaeus monodon]